MTIGQEIQAIMNKRGAHWEPPTIVIQQPSTRLANGLQEKAQVLPESSAPADAPPKLKPGTVATKLRNGQALCPDFQTGKCETKGASCSKGLHRCGKVTSSGRPCGMRFHGAHNCRSK